MSRPRTAPRRSLPGSVGLYPDYQNEEYRVDGVYYTPKGLMYRGSRLSKQGEQFENVVMSVPVDKILPVEGRSRCGYYDYDTGEIQEGLRRQLQRYDDGPDTVTKHFNQGRGAASEYQPAKDVEYLRESAVHSGT